MNTKKTSKLCLGTAQLGMDYGINNKTGKLTKNEAYRLLDMARDYGVKYLDTASVYGDSEELIGNYLTATKSTESFKIITKLNLNFENKDNIKQNIINAISTSLQKLSMECLDGLLIHNPKDFYNSEIIESILALKKRGCIKNIGVSVYEYDDGIHISSDPRIDYIQIPYNILDQRFDKYEFVHQIENSSIKVFARSPLLQGLLLMNDMDIPKHLFEAKKYIDQIDKISIDAGFTRFEMAVLFAYTNKGTDYVVFGVDSVNQFEQYIVAIEKEDKFLKFRKELEGLCEGIEKKIIMPNLWNEKNK